MNYAFKFPGTIPVDLSCKNKLCVLIVSNKFSCDKDELYSKRKEFIRWFEKNHPNDFDLYGRDWNEYIFKGRRFIRVLNNISFIKKFATRHFCPVLNLGEDNIYSCVLDLHQEKKQ